MTSWGFPSCHLWFPLREYGNKSPEFRDVRTVLRSRLHPFASSQASSPSQVYWSSISDPLCTTRKGLQPEWRASVGTKRQCSKFWGKNSRSLMPKALNHTLKDLSQIIADLKSGCRASKIFKDVSVFPQLAFEGRVWISEVVIHVANSGSNQKTCQQSWCEFLGASAVEDRPRCTEMRWVWGNGVRHTQDNLGTFPKNNVECRICWKSFNCVENVDMWWYVYLHVYAIHIFKYI